MRLPAVLQSQPKGLVLLETTLLIGMIGWGDYVTGWEWSFFAPYAIPIVFVTWKTNQRWGFLCAFLCAVTWWGAHVWSHPYSSNWSFAFAGVGWWFYFSILVLAMTAVKMRRKHDQSRILTLKREHEMEQEILRMSELEQQRVGRDLHDGLGPHLAAIGYATNFLIDALKERGQPETAQAEEIHGMVSDAAAITRDLARGIFPARLNEGGLHLALENLADTTSRQTGMSVSFFKTGDSLVVDPEDGIHLYRIAQEALSNAAKHGGARKATIVLSKKEDALRLAVADDGSGMAGSPEETPGMGIRSMQYRARALGGELNIESNASEGTIVSCEMPNRPIQPETPVP